jgi:hypothetical protein
MYLVNQVVLDQMLHDLLEAIDHDIAKSYDPELSEDPDYTEESFDELRGIVYAHVASGLVGMP